MKITKNRLKRIIKEELYELMRVPEDTYSSYEPDQDPENPIILKHLFMAAKKAMRMAQKTGAPPEVLAALDRLSEPSLSSDGVGATGQVPQEGRSSSLHIYNGS